MTLSDRNIIYQTKYFLIFFTALSLLTACGNKTNQLSTVTESTSGTAVSDREPVPQIHNQICTIVQNEDIWHKEETHFDENADGASIDGPYYSLMDLDQDGYLEIVVSAEKKQHGPSIYEVTKDEKLQKWTMSGDIPREESVLEIFEGYNKVDCYYDSALNQYHYIVQDTLFVSQSDADADWLDMVPNGSGVTFKRIGRQTFDAGKDNKFHYFDTQGSECSRSDITKKYSGLKKKTMYFTKAPISKKEAGEVWGFYMEHTLWNQFMLRDNYRSNRETELTDEFLHQFVSLSISLDEYISDLGGENRENNIRYAATDLDNDQQVEVIIENQTTKKWGIYEEADPEPRKWNIKNKKITEYSSKIPEEAWHTYSIKSYSGGLIRPDYDLIEDNLRESWLRFADHNRLP